MLDGVPSLEIPAIKTLAKFKQWVLWRHEQVDGKFTKVPYRSDHRKAASTRQGDWCSFQEAVAAKIRHDGIGYTGVGFVFSLERQNHIVGVDLDHCRDPATGKIEREAMEIIEQFNSYTEVSPSGTGIHIYCYGRLEPGAPKRTSRTAWVNGVIEIYDNQRYFTVTGEHLEDWPDDLNRADEAVAWLTQKITLSRLEKPARSVANGHHLNGHAPDSRNPPEKTKSSYVDDGLEALLEPHARPDCIVDQKMLGALIANSKRFEETWKHTRSDAKDWSGSEYDMALASFMTSAHWEPTEIMRALIAHRREHGYALKLERNPRCYYYLHTIRRARQNQRAEEAQDTIRQAASGDSEEPIDRDSVMEALGVVYGCEIKGLVKYSGDSPTYVIETGRGDVRGTIDMLMNQLMLRKSFADVVNVVVPKTSSANHDKRVQAMLDIALRIETGPDANFDELLRTWVVEYLTGMEIHESMKINDSDPNRPFMNEGKYVISSTGLAKWLREQRGQIVPLGKLAQALRKLGCAPEKFDLQAGTRKMKRSMWVVAPRVIG